MTPNQFHMALLFLVDSLWDYNESMVFAIASPLPSWNILLTAPSQMSDGLLQRAIPFA